MRIVSLTGAAVAALTSGVPAQFVLETRQLQALPADGLIALQSTFADFDGDGDPDLVTTGSLASVVRNRFYRNDGTGVFTLHAAWPDVANGSYHLVTDVDGDGDDDVLLSGTVVRNLGAGVLQAAPIAATGRPMACADFDGDGQRDLLVQSPSGLGVALFRQVGGTFVPAAVPNTNVLLAAAAARDFDGDGDVDLLLAARPYVLPFGPNWSGEDRLWRNNGLGQFVEQNLPGAQNVDTVTMVVADFDGDGDDDCALRTGGLAPAWQLRINNGVGNLVVTAGLLPANLPWAPLHGVDLDGDGDHDLAGQSAWLENDGTAHFTSRAWLQDAPSGAAVHDADVDADGDRDLIVAAGSTPRLLRNLGPGRLVDGTRTPWSRTAAGHGDLDGDGDFDLVTADGVIGINDGTGWFRESPMPWGTGQALPASLQVFDADGDTDRDVLCVFSPATGGAQLRLFRNNGNASFVDAGQSGMPASLSSYTTTAATLDADGDGDQDLVLLVRQGGVFLYANDGTGAFTAVPGAFPPYNGWLQAVAVGDLDGDGDVDVLTGDESYGAGPASSIRYFANGGTGVFADVTAQRLQAPTALTRRLVVADIDRDGDLDAFAACWGTASYPNSVNLLLRNDGAGGLTHQPTALPNVLPAGTVALGDLDDDGDLDAVVGTYQSGVRFWRNQGNTTFADGGGMYPPPSTMAYQPPLVLDVDDDADMDLLLGDSLFVNAHWDAAATQLGRVGQPFPYSVRTLTNAMVALPFIGLTFARVPLGPLGTLAMPVGAPPCLPIVPLVGGSALATYAIPADPGLLGVEFVLQSLFLGSALPHLSPAVRVPLYD